MAATKPSAWAFQFGAFELDLKAGELRKQGVKVKLQEQPFQVLATLLEQAGEVVTKDELQRRIWAADTFVDFDHGLHSAITRLREALGDFFRKPPLYRNARPPRVSFCRADEGDRQFRGVRGG